jgi:hypothetical protein
MNVAKPEAKRGESEILPELRLETLESGIPTLTSRRAGAHMEACIWCLLECGHKNGVRLKFSEKDKCPSFYRISWPESAVNIEKIQRAYTKDDGPEDGAVAIALLLIRERTHYTAVKRATARTGIDYWLGYKTTQTNQIFSSKDARLEISGILKESRTNTPQYRIVQKLKQTKQSDYTSSPAYVIVVEFSQPMAEMDFRNARS